MSVQPIVLQCSSNRGTLKVVVKIGVARPWNTRSKAKYYTCKPTLYADKVAIFVKPSGTPKPVEARGSAHPLTSNQLRDST